MGKRIVTMTVVVQLYLHCYTMQRNITNWMLTAFIVLNLLKNIGRKLWLSTWLYIVSCNMATIGRCL